MSQVVTRTNISEIESLSITGHNSGWNVGAIVMPVVASVASAAVRELITGSVDIESAKLNVAYADSTILSPNELRSKFASCYQMELDALSMKQFASDIKQKAAVVNTLKRLSYVGENKEAIGEKIQQVINAPSGQVHAKIENLMKEVEEQHAWVFTKELAAVVVEASKEAGFRNVQVVYKTALPEILAQDSKGRAIRSEVHMNRKTKVLNLVSETIGISDGKCHDVMDAFSRALEKRGVKSATTDPKWTGGQCWLPGSRDAEQKMRKRAQAEEARRTRKLNTRTKLTNRG